ncbi:MAG: DUF4149 domain-containing protein [Pseudomonadota bacterium]
MPEFAALIAAASLGGMLFFSAVVTPSLFGALDEKAAGRVLRTVFPRYFLVHAALAGVAAIIAVAAGQTSAGALMAAGAAILFASRQIAVPIINDARDAMDAGDAAAKKTFGRWHGGSVIANVIEMVILVASIRLLLG